MAQRKVSIELEANTSKATSELEDLRNVVGYSDINPDSAVLKSVFRDVEHSIFRGVKAILSAFWAAGARVHY